MLSAQRFCTNTCRNVFFVLFFCFLFFFVQLWINDFTSFQPVVLMDLVDRCMKSRLDFKRDKIPAVIRRTYDFTRCTELIMIKFWAYFNSNLERKIDKGHRKDFSRWLSGRVTIINLSQGEKFKFFAQTFFLATHCFVHGKSLSLSLNLRFSFFFNVRVLEMFSSSDVWRSRQKQTAALTTHFRIWITAPFPG